MRNRGGQEGEEEDVGGGGVGDEDAARMRGGMKMRGGHGWPGGRIMQRGR